MVDEMVCGGLTALASGTLPEDKDPLESAVPVDVGIFVGFINRNRGYMIKSRSRNFLPQFLEFHVGQPPGFPGLWEATNQREARRDNLVGNSIKTTPVQHCNAELNSNCDDLLYGELVRGKEVMIQQPAASGRPTLFLTERDGLNVVEAFVS